MATAVERSPGSTPTREEFKKSYIPPAATEDDGGNAGRALVEKNAEAEAAEPDAATKRAGWAADATNDDIKRGQTTQKVGNGIASAGSVIATAGGIIALVGGPVGIVVGAVVAVIGAIIGIIGGIVSAVGKGQVNKATGEKNAHLDDVNKGINNASSAGEKAKMLNKKNQIDAYRQKEKSLNHEIAKQEEYMQTLDPEKQPQKYKSAQKDLQRMNTTKGKYQTHIGEYEKSVKPSPTAEATNSGSGGTLGADPALAMNPNSAAEGVDATGTGATDVASNPSGTTTAPATGTSSAPATTTTAPPPAG